jgi:hypothetical protein
MQMSRRDVGAARAGCKARFPAFVLATAMVLGGCGSAESDPNPATAPSGKAKPARPAPRADMVAAVSASRSPGAVDVKFALAGRPVVGRPVDIRLALTPVIELDSLYARFQASEGLELVKGAETEHLDRPRLNTEVTHTLTVTPKSDGIFYVTATVLSDSPKESVSRIYSIPIIAGAGISEAPPAAAIRPESRAGSTAKP